jgi:hypothetical protein
MYLKIIKYINPSTLKADFPALPTNIFGIFVGVFSFSALPK